MADWLQRLVRRASFPTHLRDVLSGVWLTLYLPTVVMVPARIVFLLPVFPASQSDPLEVSVLAHNRQSLSSITSSSPIVSLEVIRKPRRLRYGFRSASEA